MLIRTGGAGSVTSLFVRGGESNYNKVLLDGMPLNEPGGTFNFSNLTTENLERIEIVRGAQSALFGSDAMASVVQLFTKRRRSRATGGRTRRRLDRRRHLRHGPRRRGRVGRVRPRSTTRSARRGSTPTTACRTTASRTRRCRRTSACAIGDTATLRVDRPRRARARRHAGADGVRTAGPRCVLSSATTASAASRSISSSLAPFASAPRTRSPYSHQQSTDLVADPPYTPQFDDRVAPFAVFRFHVRQPDESAAPPRELPGGLAADDRRVGLRRSPSDGARGLGRRARHARGSARGHRRRRRRATTSASSVQHQALWARTFVTVGARVEHNDSFGTAAVPRGSIVYVAHQSSGTVGDTRLKASAGLGIKEPTMLQSFSPSPFFKGNPDLQPERSRTVEAGIEQRFARRSRARRSDLVRQPVSQLIATRTTDPGDVRAPSTSTSA